MTIKRVLIGLVLVVAPAVVSAGAASSSQSTRYVSVRLAQVECQTTFGIQGQRSIAMASSVVRRVPARFRNQLTVYSDGHGIIKLLAPSGWDCVADIGADGSSTLDIYPPSEVNKAIDSFDSTTGGLPSNSPDQEVFGRQTSACVGCALSQACPVFPAAASLMVSQQGSTCPSTAPSSESSIYLSAHLREIIDPPGTVGDNYPSGGANTALGVMTFYQSSPSSNGGSWAETCILPASRRGLCIAALNAFISSYGAY
jgi:hypothetical protein